MELKVHMKLRKLAKVISMMIAAVKYIYNICTVYSLFHVAIWSLRPEATMAAIPFISKVRWTAEQLIFTLPIHVSRIDLERYCIKDR